MDGWIPKQPIRENITPRGDGNLLIVYSSWLFLALVHKREYNSERRRKHSKTDSVGRKLYIRENITPRGDGNFILLTKNQYVFIMLI